MRTNGVQSKESNALLAKGFGFSSSEELNDFFKSNIRLPLLRTISKLHSHQMSNEEIASLLTDSILSSRMGEKKKHANVRETYEHCVTRAYYNYSLTAMSCFSKYPSSSPNDQVWQQMCLTTADSQLMVDNFVCDLTYGGI